jgi:predicted TIM-barrel fold metal-dependent hydrolase
LKNDYGLYLPQKENMMQDNPLSSLAQQVDLEQRMVAVTCDAHAGPLLEEQLRSYCPSKYLDEFDEFVANVRRVRPKEPVLPDIHTQAHLRNALTTGGWDPHQRIRDLDRDGVAGEVIFHGLTLGRADFMPFNDFQASFGAAGYSNELVGAGRHIYNQWLADFVSVEPERHAGLAYMPFWDPDACAAEATLAAEKGLRGIYFPRPQSGILPYNDPAWERFWSVCEDHQLPLTTHSQHAGPAVGPRRPGDHMIEMLDILGPPARRGLHLLIFGGVFDRHPGLRLVFTEQSDNWWSTTLNLMDSLARYGERELGLPPEFQMYEGPPYGYVKLKRLPSEYCAENVFIGGTCLAPFEAADAVENSYASQVMWGSDYPHPEGSWQYPRYAEETPITHLHLRDTFSEIDLEHTTMLIGGNTIRVYSFDGPRLQAVANRINSLTAAELATPLSEEPEDFTTRCAKICFRRNGPLD